MAVGFRNGAGSDFDLLFNAGTTQAPGFRKTGGANLAYAPRTTTKIADVGFREANASDLSNKWERRNVAPPVPGFNGGVYTELSQGPTGQTGNTSASILLTMRADGSWTIVGSQIGSFTPGFTTLASGVWRVAGSSSGEYTVMFSAAPTSGPGTVTNSAPTARPLSSTQSIELLVSVPAASSQDRIDTRTITATLVRTGYGTAVATCEFTCAATGWL